MTFSFITYRGQGSHSVIPNGRTSLPPDASLIAEFDSNSNFTDPIIAGTVTQENGNFILELTAGEVSNIKSGSFRIAHVYGSTRSFLIHGKISYVNNRADPNTEVETLANVALSGNYNDLNNKPNFATQAAANIGAAEIVQNHVNNSEPHPAYDDLPSLTLLFENGLM